MGYETIKCGRSLAATYDLNNVKLDIAHEMAEILIKNNLISFSKSEVEGFHIVTGTLDVVTDGRNYR